MRENRNYQAFIFDLNGTMIDDMPYHIRAWHRILNELGAQLSMEQTKQECYGKNNELLERIFPGRFSEAEKDRMSLEKEIEYQQQFLPHLKLLDGLPELLHRAREKGIRMAIGSAAILFNIDFVLDGLNIRRFIDAIVSADHVKTSKPDPETFTSCARQLHLPPPACLVFEDAPKGAEAANRAGMDCIVVTTLHRPPEFDHLNNIIGFIKDYNDPLINELS
jgi:beta-phosphoglucomutase